MTEPPSPDNLAARTVRHYFERLQARDWDTVADLLADNYRFEDRRLGLKDVQDKAGSMEQARVVANLGVESVELHVVETRGDHAALVRLTYLGGGYEAVSLAVGAVGSDGRMVRAASFDEHALDAARKALDELAATER